MSTDAQIAANRLNSLKSTGPTSPEGKARSSLNALKSGIDAQSHIIPGEDPADLEALTESFLALFHPTDPNQLSLVDTLISAEWTQRRLRRIEAQLWNIQAESNDHSIHSFLGQAYQNAIDPLTRVQRRVDATNRLYLRTLKALQDLQSAPAPSLPTQSLTPAIGFVPQVTPATPATEPRTSVSGDMPLPIHSAHAKSQILIRPHATPPAPAL